MLSPTLETKATNKADSGEVTGAYAGAAPPAAWSPDNGWRWHYRAWFRELEKREEELGLEQGLLREEVSKTIDEIQRHGASFSESLDGHALIARIAPKQAREVEIRAELVLLHQRKRNLRLAAGEAQ